MGYETIGENEIWSKSLVGRIGRLELSNDILERRDVAESSVSGTHRLVTLLSHLHLEFEELPPSSQDRRAHPIVATTSFALTALLVEMSLEWNTTVRRGKILNVGDENFGSFCDSSLSSHHDYVAVKSIQRIGSTRVIEHGSGGEQRRRSSGISVEDEVMIQELVLSEDVLSVLLDIEAVQMRTQSAKAQGTLTERRTHSLKVQILSIRATSIKASSGLLGVIFGPA